MWYVEAMNGDRHERWEGLTQDQSKAVHLKYYDEDFGCVRSGRMNTEK